VSTAPDDNPTAVRLAEVILSSETVRRARAAVRCLHDVPLLATVSGVVVDVTLDLLYETTDGRTALVLYDFDGRGTVAGPRVALAFAAATGRTVDAVEVVSVRADDAAESTVSSLGLDDPTDQVWLAR
jgi:hypothetical protein